ncbi:MAG: Ldh family oxidoreductase, partial [Actinomycetota bacterium]|nr:Ldh family oxidoreductase [Actinomycetota bacterium]
MSVVVEESALAALIRECFTGLGLGMNDAAAVAQVCVYANLRGIDSHGLARVPAYMRKVHAGLAGGTERMAAGAGSGALCRLDGGRALGPAAAVK